MNERETGIMIALYGINSIGKSTQAAMLVHRLEKEGFLAVHKKYPFYGLHPTGSILNAYLREGNPYKLSPREFQIFQAFNRTHAERTMRGFLVNGTNVVAEDYTGTGIAWGMGAGIDKNFLILINTHLYTEDVSILLDGDQFESGREAKHKHENDRILTSEVRRYHKVLANEFGWHIVNANQDRDAVHEKIWSIVAPELER